MADTRVEAKARLVADWWRAESTDLADNVMIAYRRSDVAELNAVARTILEQEGRLEGEKLTLTDGTEIAVGDRVLCTRNDRALDIANGSRGTVTAVDPAERTATIELDDGRRVTLPRRYLDRRHLVHAYALTGHKTQGLTVERAFVLADDRRALREWGYVALTRARETTRVYTIANHVEPDASPHRPEPAGPVDRLADALARPAAQTLALDAAGPGSTLRTLVAEKHALDDRRDRIARERHRTARKLETLGVLGRVRHRRSLQESMRKRDEQLRSLERELERKDREIEVARERAFSNARSRRQTPARSLERERSLGHGLER